MIEILSKIVSWVFLPLMMPVYVVIFMMFFPTFQSEIGEHSLQIIDFTMGLKWALIIIFFFFSVITPGLSLMIMKSNNMISTIDIDDKEERPKPIMVGIFNGLILFFTLRFQAPFLPQYFYALPLSGVVVLLVMLLFNRFLKVSMHAAGVGVSTGFLLAFCGGQVIFPLWILPTIILISGTVLSARVYLKKHSLQEVYLGFSIGACLTFLLTNIYPIN